MSATFLKSAKISDEYLNIALAQVKLGFWELDLSTGKIECTTQNRLNFGFGIDQELTEEMIIMAMLPEDRPKRAAVVRAAMNPLTPVYSIEFRVRHTCGRIVWLQGRGTVIFEDGKAKRIIGTTLDISEKKGIELSRDELLNIANHELKTPLSAVKGYLQLLLRYISGKKNEQYAGIAQRALTASEKIERLMNEALDAGLHQASEMVLKKESIDLYALISENVSNAALIYPAAEIKSSTQVEKPLISVDKYRIAQVLTNLINNAIKYSPDDNRIEIKLLDATDFLRVEIRDYGMGIPKEEQVKIFDKFYRIKQFNDTIQGTGIGLFLCSEIISRHGGHIGIATPADGIGSIFYFTLPSGQTIGNAIG